MSRPFTGVRILDFTQVLAGPYGSYQLALLGADVIKVERREGEDMRRTPLSREWAERGMAPSWLAINGNKRSLTLDFRKPAAIEIVRSWLAESRRRDGEFPRRRDGSAGHRLRGAVGDQPEPDLLRDLRLRRRPGRTATRQATTAKSRRCPASCRSPGIRKWDRPAPASRCATCCRA